MLLPEIIEELRKHYARDEHLETTLRAKNERLGVLITQIRGKIGSDQGEICAILDEIDEIVKLNHLPKRLATLPATAVVDIYAPPSSRKPMPHKDLSQRKKLSVRLVSKGSAQAQGSAPSATIKSRSVPTGLPMLLDDEPVTQKVLASPSSGASPTPSPVSFLATSVQDLFSKSTRQIAERRVNEFPISGGGSSGGGSSGGNGSSQPESKPHHGKNKLYQVGDYYLTVKGQVYRLEQNRLVEVGQIRDNQIYDHGGRILHAFPVIQVHREEAGLMDLQGHSYQKFPVLDQFECGFCE